MKKKPVLFILLVTTFFLSRQLLAAPSVNPHPVVLNHVEGSSRATTVRATGTRVTTATAHEGKTVTKAANIRGSFDFANAISVPRANLTSPKTTSLLMNGGTVRTTTSWGDQVYIVIPPGAQAGKPNSVALCPKGKSMSAFLGVYIPSFTGRSLTATRRDVNALLAGRTVTLTARRGDSWSNCTMRVVQDSASKTPALFIGSDSATDPSGLVPIVIY